MTSQGHVNLLFDVEIQTELGLRPHGSANGFNHINRGHIATEGHLVYHDGRVEKRPVLLPLCCLLSQYGIVLLPELFRFGAFLKAVIDAAHCGVVAVANTFMGEA